MKMRLLFLALNLLAPLSTLHAQTNSTLLLGSLQFPSTVTTLEPISMYCAGKKVPCEVRHQSLAYTLSADRRNTTFFLLITPSIKYEMAGNTIKYLKVDQQEPYAFYMLRFVTSTDKDGKPSYAWKVIEHELLFEDGRVPDNTLIMCYNPEFIDRIEGGSAMTLPTIFIKSDIVDVVGSQQNLHDASIEMLLSSLDYDAIHAKIENEVTYKNKLCKVIAATA